MQHIRGLVTVLAALALLATAVVATTDTATADDAQRPDEADPSMVLVLDSSGSMDETDASGQRKIDAAREALHSVVDSLPGDAVVGLRVFGATVFSADDPGACEDSQLVVPVGPADTKALHAAVDDYEPYGETPISHALRQAADDLGDDGQRTIVLVSDGESTCQPDPCEVAAEIAAAGIDLRIDVVGFGVDAAAREQLSCIAERGHGTYHDVSTADELAATLDTVSTRAIEAFEVSGTPVSGTPEPADAPRLEPGGQYTDTVPTAGQTQHYLLTRTSPGSNLVVGVSGRPHLDGLFSEVGLHLQTPEGDDCDDDYVRALGDGAASTIAGAVSTLNDHTFDQDGPCATADEIVLSLDQTAGEDVAEAPVQFKVWEYGPVEGLDQLPPEAPYTDVTADPLPAGNDPVELAGGSSFETAAKLEPGQTYADTVVPGEMRLFKVPAEWGQRLRAQAATEPLGGELADLVEPSSHLGITLFGPTGSEATATSDSSSTLHGSAGAEVRASTLPIRYRNFASAQDFGPGSAIAGDYYVGVSVGADSDGDTPEIPYTLTVDLAGQAGQDTPEFADVTVPDDDTTTEPAPEDDSASSTPVANGEDDAPGAITPARAALGLGGLALLLVGGLFIVRWLRPRSQP